jgi:hypothetical protein
MSRAEGRIMTDRLEQALQLSEEILEGLEMGSLTVAASALRCLRLARLVADFDGVTWLQYETIGYPKTSDGFIENVAFLIARKHGREMLPVKEKGRRSIFTELADELEAQIQTHTRSLSNYSTSGASVAGEYAGLAMMNLTTSVTNATNNTITNVQLAQRRLTTLRGEYYSYALSVNLELKFSKRAEDVFRSYRLAVDNHLAGLAPDSLKKLDAAYERLQSDNSESWAQAVTSCRRVIEEIANALYRKVFIRIQDDTYTTHSGKTLKVSGAAYINRLYAIIDKISTSKTARKLVSSKTMLLVELVESLHACVF